MKVLHVVKTSEGALWAARQAAVLVSLGVEVHAALPRLQGEAVRHWRDAGAVLHECDLDTPVRRPQRLPEVRRRVRTLIDRVLPDVIHSHFVGTTLMLRLALGKNHPLPRIFQVPGPLHLEHGLYRRLELALAGAKDYWLGSSRCIVNRYLKAGIDHRRVFLSYYGDSIPAADREGNGLLRSRAGASPDEILIGTISWMYAPKRFLGQRIGLKAHEDLIEALAIVCRRNRRVRGVIAGAAWNGADWYMNRLQRHARRVAGDRIVFTGPLPCVEAKQAWRDLDLAVHVPISENCGGVVEPMLARVPVIASSVGGLPEVIFDRVTGRLVPSRNPRRLADTILKALEDREHAAVMAARGQQLVREMFDVQRTAREVYKLYRHILHHDLMPQEYDSANAVGMLLVPTAEELFPMAAGTTGRTPEILEELTPCPH